jgi:hypothetical protein
MGMKPIRNEIRDDFDILIENFDEIITGCNLPIICIYFNTRDYPDKYVARLFDILNGKPQASRYITLGYSLEVIRNTLPEYMTNLNRNTMDDEKIVECWI